MLALLSSLIGFLATIVLAIVLMSGLMPRLSDRPAPIGWIILIVALIGGYIGYRLGG
jgi:hypothetical protein